VAGGVVVWLLLGPRVSASEELDVMWQCRSVPLGYDRVGNFKIIFVVIFVTYFRSIPLALAELLPQRRNLPSFLYQINVIVTSEKP
jgi:hypothetical protein